jgi:sulfur carrier protein
MILKVNGEIRTVDRPLLTVVDLLSVCEVESPDLVSVQVNGKFLNKDRYGATQLEENDEVDFLYFLGGGR